MTSILFSFLHLLFLSHPSQAQHPNTTITTSTCTPCQTYAFYRATPPDFLDLASIADLFSLSRLMISNPSNISSPTSPLIPNQPLFIPITCSCYSINFNTTFSLSYSNLTYTIKKYDTFYYVSTHHFQNLTTYQSVEFFNPTLLPTLLPISTKVVFPLFCKCPNKTHLQKQFHYFITYVFQPSDTLTSVASMFGSNKHSIIDVNGGDVNIKPFDIIFIPVFKLPILKQPRPGSFASQSVNKSTGVILGMGLGLGFSGFLLVFVSGFWCYREALFRKRKIMDRDEERQNLNGKGQVEVNLMADVSDCLDKYRVIGIEELREATDGFHQRSVIEGSVYKGCFDGEIFAIKKMKWNATDELKILRKVNHGNLVKLEGFCIDIDDLNCYLIYEYVQNGSLHSWLHETKDDKRLNWKTRLRIAIDVANGLQYIHEHTQPQVVHKDIKSSNILLDSNMRAKIANFGLAKSGCNAITMHIKGTQGYIAPEYLFNGAVSTKMDVFSFGVVLLELVTGRGVVDGEGKVLWEKINETLDSKEEKESTLKKWIDDVIVSESCSMESVMNVMAISIACLHRDPLRRPNMVDVVYALCKSDDVFFDFSNHGLSPRQVVAR